MNILKFYVSEDYSGKTNIKKEDREKVDIVKTIKSKIEVQLKIGEYGFAPKYQKGSDFIAYFEELCNRKGHSSYWCTLKHLKNCYGSKLLFSHCTEDRIKEFVEHLSKNLKSVNTQHHYFKLINVAFNQAIKEKITTVNPIIFLERNTIPKKQESNREFLTLEELQML